MKTTDILQSFLLSLVLVFLLFCVFWAGIYASYIKYYGIGEFFNPFFGNVFNPVAFFICVGIFGIGLAIPFLDKFFKFLFFVSLVCVLSLFVPPFGRVMGGIFLAKEQVITTQGEQKSVNSLYENHRYIVYLSADSDDFETRKRNLIYYEKPIAK
ncbi:hypothetical protein IP360_07245 [Helicobacter winghamensis]|uniref:Uncharacterized protein n=1 Tax=Helicobacter winghamensis TaxID=157268 RepID=A0A2N3PLL3_9HELI|nr:hypothetical protein [Helicobacter winghamensis]PKT75163.1 hypothetical protein BCM35_01680 [Helicobacter winghamensis]PKT75238.1 hypothetical protein BCM32_06735 [Helicobacter winghamensis]PKT75314.1 hypothetical protein BCM34_06390 [Helicobacter winghamensis]PKT82734.1 hypothetical protein BCM31_06160 [Helicobacter winghamensis]PKT82869.1 hypothetical protein BCM33_05635 [Helicobacter winghamensis]